MTGPPGAAVPVLRATALTKRYGSDEYAVEALRGVSLSVHAGELVAVVGPSGSGKSTLLGILGCLDRPTSGSYEVDGEEVAGFDDAKAARVRREKLGFIFQSYHLLPRASAYENVELPLVYAQVPARRRRERVLRALAVVGLEDRVEHRPSELSGGQQQRVSIARALVNEPRLLLADEPTGNLDSGSETVVLDMLGALNADGMTIVVVTHSTEVAARAHRIVTMRDGLIQTDLESVVASAAG